jgi:hypothetical protein
MNTVRFNEPFDGMLTEVIEMRGDKPPVKFDWSQSPLFYYESTESRETELKKAYRDDPDMTIRLPFPSLRLSLKQTDSDAPGRGCYQTDYVGMVSRDSERLHALVRVKRMFDEDAGRGPAFKDFAFLISDVNWNSREQLPGDKGYMVEYKAMVRADHKWILDWSESAAGDGISEVISAAMDCFISFAIDAMLPSTHIATVRPDQPGRSVEWLRQRTHYTLITHGHPANNPNVREGGNVVSDPKAELRRMAHARRAHYRELRAARFRFARGKRVFVRASWVGPKEWREEGSRQIYRILEPVK